MIFLPLGAVVILPLKIAFSAMGTLFEADGTTAYDVSFALDEYVGFLFASTISPSLLSAKEIAPSFDQSHERSVEIVSFVPSAYLISRIFVSQPY